MLMQAWILQKLKGVRFIYYWNAYKEDWQPRVMMFSPTNGLHVTNPYKAHIDSILAIDYVFYMYKVHPQPTHSNT